MVRNRCGDLVKVLLTEPLKRDISYDIQLLVEAEACVPIGHIQHLLAYAQSLSPHFPTPDLWGVFSIFVGWDVKRDWQALMCFLQWSIVPLCHQRIPVFFFLSSE